MGTAVNALATAAEIHLVALCLDCRRRHPIVANPATWLARMSEWEIKHRGHRMEFRTPSREIDPALKDRELYPALDQHGHVPWWMEFSPNADIKLAHGASADLTITLAALATSSTFLAGRESTVVSNATNLYLDYLMDGKVTTGTSPTTAKSIRIYLYASIADTPAYPDVFDGTDSAETVSAAEVLNQLPLLWALGTNATDNQTYPALPKAVSLAFGGVIPQEWGAFVAHDTAVNLNATGGNHRLSVLPCYATAA